MKEEELKYMLCLLDNLTVEIFQEIIQIFNDLQEAKPPKSLSGETITFFERNLKNNPVTTSTIISYLQENLLENDVTVQKLQSLYLEILKHDISDSAGNADKLITLLSLVRWKESFLSQFTSDILNQIPFELFRQHKKQILISLLLQNKPELLKITSDLMHKNEPQKRFKLTAEYMLELCYQDKTHWLMKAAHVYKQQLHDMKNVTFEINNFTKQILIMVLIDLTNCPETYDLPSLVHQLTNIFSILDNYMTSDRQLQFYITEVKRELTVIKFCLENNYKIMTTSMFSQVLGQSALTVISQVCRLSKVDRYKVSRLLNTNNEFINELITLSNKVGDKAVKQTDLNWDVSTYNAYCVITKIIDAIVTSSEEENVQEITTLFDDIKRLILSIQPLQYCIEIIETIFSCLFIRYEYFSCPEHNQEYPCGTHSECSYFYSKKPNKFPKSINSSSAGFMCSATTTQNILNTLKTCLEVLVEKHEKTDSDDSEHIMGRLKRTVNVVNHSIWKMQLVSTLSPDTNPLQLKLCLDYVKVDDSSEEEDREMDIKPTKKKLKSRRRHTNSKFEVDHVMLASTISASDETYAVRESNIDFISIMLAKPTCLVALALYHNDFSKANQILEMFDLADSEIATEVTFSEQLRHLVAKIKNILYYRDCARFSTKELSALSIVATEVMGHVEGFLATNIAPNSFDVIELGVRHPHLQLYSHQNAPFVNAVDILLSSGLNREITDGLINVVERKLVEVKNSTDVAAVKKTNYIKFVGDIVMVTFEIFGDSESSFEYADNICSLVTDCRIPIKYDEFCGLNELSKVLRQSCQDLAAVIDPSDMKRLDESLLGKYHQIYMNVVAASDKDLCNVGEVLRQGTKKERVHYLRMCYMYSKSVSQLEQEDRAAELNADAPYFSMLDRPLHDIFGNMINNREMPVTYLEPICKKLNVNLIPKLILNFCPPITLMVQNKEASEENFINLLQAVYEFKNSEEKLFLEHTADFAPLPRTPDPQCLTYVVLHNWVLAHIIKKIHTSLNESNMQHSMDARTKCLNKYMELERFDHTKILFGGNKYLASIHSVMDLDKLFAFMPQLIESGKILQCLKLIDALSERQLMNSANLMNLRDLILFKLATNPKLSNNWKYCQHLKCPELKLDLIVNNLNMWPADGAMEALDYLRFTLNQSSLEEGLYEKCTSWITRIPLYEQISTIMNVNHWYSIYKMSIENPESIIEVLIDSQQFKLCLDWADLHDISENMKNLIVVNLLRQLFEYTNQATPEIVKKLLARLSTSQAIDLIQEEMSKVRNVEILQVCIDFISENLFDWKSFENIKIGLQIMTEIDVNLRSIFWELIEKPLLMIEQFLMNGKLDILADIINKISSNLKNDPNGENLYYNIKSIESLVISRNAVDALLRYYAEKALDMRNPTNVPPTPLKPHDDSLLQSIDSINLEAASKPFVMPESVPTKDQWVEDYTTDRCMLCKISIFSMIIRRHHCRRCGRLVCHACSRNRMQVPTYPSGVKFRVCDDCFAQTLDKRARREQHALAGGSTSESGGSGASCLDWCLSACAARNDAVRAEFGYEFTPDVTLCLSIMKMHSINLDYPRFLLDRSEEAGRELARGGDARLLVRARRSLLLAAAELYARAPHAAAAGGGAGDGAGGVAEAGAAHVARCLAHADALATLVRHQAHHLVPQQGAQPSQIVRALLEAEKWELALEIATKSGISRSSVLAAWGKACLRAGCYQEARRKFALCFKNTANVCVETYDDVEYGKEASESQEGNTSTPGTRLSERTASTSSAQAEARAKANPPLLNEIISMLEDINYPVNQQLLDKAEAIKTTNEKLTMMNTGKKKIQVAEPALNIMHMLASVKKIKQGDYSDFQTAVVQPKKSLAHGLLRRNNHHSEPRAARQQKRLDPFFYRECVYYLTNYGSHVANITFYMKHSSLGQVLRYCCDNQVDKETFTDTVYMDCLKKDIVNELLKAMSDMDSTLEMWAEYIMHVCRTLETGKRLEALYAVQCGSGQQARAAATCALQYARAAPRAAPYAALLARAPLLAAAQHHLASCVPSAHKMNDPKSLQFNLDKVTIDSLMTTMTRQMELAKYLASAEASGKLNERVLDEVIPVQSGRASESGELRPLTLFGSTTDKIRLVAAALVAGQTVEEGFPLAFKIITEHKLDSMNIYTHVSKYLVNADRFMEVRALARCIRASKETAASLLSDQALEAGVRAVVARCAARGQLHDEQAELLIDDVRGASVKISCYLWCRNVSSAYILAARLERGGELRRVLHEAERLGNEHVRSACYKRLAARNLPS